jgi:glutaredoxin
MDIPEPSNKQFTIYSKSGCPNCIKVKRLLQEKQINFTVVDCDEFILEDKDAFLKFIQNLANKEYKTFPMVFDDNNQFIGGFVETHEYIDTFLTFNETF